MEIWLNGLMLICYVDILVMAMYLGDDHILHGPSLCNQSFVDGDRSPGLVDWTSVKGKCVVNDTMKIVWDDPNVRPELVKHYLVHVRYQSSSLLTCFKTKRKETFFTVNMGADLNEVNEISFLQGEELYVQIETYPRVKGQETKEVGVGSCPSNGEWASWNPWSPCHCPCPSDHQKCVGTKSRNRFCLYKENGQETYDFNCKPGSKNENANCIRTCKVVDTLSATPVTGQISKKQERSTSTSIMGNKYLLSVMLSCFAISLLAFILFLLYFRGRRKKRKSLIVGGVEESPSTLQEKRSVYVSYICPSPQKEEDLLKMVGALHEYGIECVIDLLNTIEINNCGGPANWVTDRIHGTDKIIVLLSKDYLQALNRADSTAKDSSTTTPPIEVDGQVCKVNMEFKLITSMLYSTCQSDKVILVLGKEVKNSEIPPLFQGMLHCTHPKTFGEKDNGFTKLLGIVLGTEPIQMTPVT